MLEVVILLIVFTHRRRFLESSLPQSHRRVQIEAKRASDLVHESGFYDGSVPKSTPSSLLNLTKIFCQQLAVMLLER